MPFFRKKLSKLSAALLAAMLALPVVAAPHNMTADTLVSGQSQNSFATDLTLAKQGNADAQNEMGMRYMYGLDNVKQDFTQAKMWLEKAAAQGDDAAQNNFGYMYMQGRGVKQDYTKAKTLYEQSAAQGNSSAQENLNYLRQKGLIR